MESLRGYAADIEGGRQPFRDSENWLESRKLSGEGLLLKSALEARKDFFGESPVGRGSDSPWALPGVEYSKHVSFWTYPYCAQLMNQHGAVTTENCRLRLGFPPPGHKHIAHRKHLTLPPVANRNGACLRALSPDHLHRSRRSRRVNYLVVRFTPNSRRRRPFTTIGTAFTPEPPGAHTAHSHHLPRWSPQSLRVFTLVFTGLFTPPFTPHFTPTFGSGIAENMAMPPAEVVGCSHR